MKIKFTIGLLTLLYFTVSGQERILTTDSDTVFWQKYYSTILSQAGVEPIDKTKNDFVFRFWDGIKVIELSNSETGIKGTVTFIIKQNKHKKEGKLYYRKSELTSETIKLLQDQLVTTRLLEIPTYEQIEGWKIGLDGRTYIIEYADKSKISYKVYWSPYSYQYKLKEAKTLIDYITGLNEIEEINTLHKKFMNRQPFSSWYTFIGSAVVAVKIY